MATGRSSSMHGLSDETFDILCSMCRKKKRTIEADKFCFDCNDYYCSVCVRFHNDVPALTTHKITDKAQSNQGCNMAFPVVPTERCGVYGHNQKPLDTFCKKHDIVGCYNCMKDNHRGCDTVSVSDYVKRNLKDCNSKEADRKLTRIAQSLNDLMKPFVKEKEDQFSKEVNILREIRKLRHEINQRVDELENNTLQELDRTLNPMTTRSYEIIKTLQEAITDVESAHNNMKSAGNNQSQIFVIMKTASEKASQAFNDAKHKIHAAEGEMRPADINFIPNEKLLTMLYAMENLGILSEKQKIKSKRPQDKTTGKSRQTRAQQTSTDLFMYQYLSFPTKIGQVDQGPSGTDNSSILKTKGKRKIYLGTSMRGLSNYETCSIISICELEKGIVIVTFSGDGHVLYLDSETFKVKSTYKPSYYAFRVCATNKKEIAVSLHKSGIEFISVGNTMQNTKSIWSDQFRCKALAYGNGKLYVSSETALYTVSGDRLEKFGHDQSAKALFSDIQRLAISRDNSRIYVADWKNGLIVLDINGKLIQHSNPPELQAATDVCLYTNAKVLVCGYQSKNILQFSADGKLMGEVLKIDNLKLPQSICLYQNNSQLIIGYENSTSIEIHEIDC